MSEACIRFASANVELRPAPINPSFITEGNPVARTGSLAVGSDGWAFSVVWDCTAGKFNWIYDFDETCFFLEGSAIIDDGVNGPRRICPGDVAFFPNGSTAAWHVEEYVKKVAFCHFPVAAFAQLPIKVLRKLGRKRSTL
jgi:uncharacterized cupin superfamily protein